MLMAFSASAIGLSCDDLKAKIEKKVDGKGVKGYTLTVVDKATETKNRVVGTCESGAKKIIYERKAKEAAEKAS
jgi:hypothetical protein